MSSLRAVLVRALDDLQGRSVPHAIIGGLAVSARVEPRMTRDVDVAVAAKSDAEAEQTVFALQGLGYTVHSVVEQTGTARLATARLLPPGANAAGVVVDLLFASSGIEPELVAAAEPLEIVRNTVAPVATVGHLIALKLLATSDERPQDAADLVRLVSVATEREIERAAVAVRTIEERGFARGRDLRAALRELLATGG
ncbi:MAG: nucleotidyl transferase AbiEii/AbiGii toxin family protein [Deltaproteobacteria bacterium]|nr:nucleotidyl transferase AbiEii/AbiGii toxin family protein [Deltaproteobacteria bacterium]